MVTSLKGIGTFNPEFPMPSGISVAFDQDGDPIIVIEDMASILPGTVESYAKNAGIWLQWNIGEIKIPIRFVGMKGYTYCYPELIDEFIEDERSSFAQGFCQVPADYYWPYASP